MLREVERIVRKYVVAILVDGLGVILAFYVALALRFAGQGPLEYLLQFRRSVLFITGVYLLFNGLFGLYARIWLYASTDEIVSIIESVVISTLLIATVDLLWPGERPLPLSVVLAGGFFALTGFVLSRYRARLLRAFLRSWESRASDGTASGTRVLVVGAGEAGQLLAWRLRNQPEGLPYHIVGFVDDDPKKHGMLIHGVRVLGDRHLIPEITQQEQVDLIIVAIHTIDSKNFRDILAVCEKTTARIKTLPDVFERLQSLSDDSLLRDITIDDLLGRELVSIERQECRALLADTVVLVTGAAGSIGSGLCQQIVQFEPRRLVMLDNNETGLYELGVQLRAALQTLGAAAMLSRMCYIVADITGRHRMESIFSAHRPQIVLHAAAYKHVPLMEASPEEAIRVNVGGTLALLELAAAYAVERFVFVSTDKAVEPLSVMGATKRVGEMLISSSARDGGLIATAVRFGNVLGSRGSVVPTFEQQIAIGGPVTVTHPDATRFFMSLDEAAKLILQAASMAEGGEVFIPDIGQQIKIADLAHKMIRLRGLRVGEDISIIYTGLRPGEKLQETLLASWEHKHSTSHPAISYVSSHNQMSGKVLTTAVRELLDQLEQGVPGTRLREALFDIVAKTQRQVPGETSAPAP